MLRKIIRRYVEEIQSEIQAEAEAEVKSQSQDNEKKEEALDIRAMVKKKLKSIRFMRGVRVQLSNRLESYGRKWNFLFFFLNVEAIIIVLLALTNTIDIVKVGRFQFSFELISGIFTLYVILLQYYVNILNYNERSLRVHYHQLELEDLNIELNMLALKMDLKEASMNEIEIIEKYEKIAAQYQLAVKNNENHREIDFERLIYGISAANYKRGKSAVQPTGKPVRDLTLDIALIYGNTILTIAMLLFICYAMFF